jgi:hypothetical protein
MQFAKRRIFLLHEQIKSNTKSKKLSKKSLEKLFQETLFHRLNIALKF